jgi:hypothetical protein
VHFLSKFSQTLPKSKFVTRGGGGVLGQKINSVTRGEVLGPLSHEVKKFFLLFLRSVYIANIMGGLIRT